MAKPTEQDRENTQILIGQWMRSAGARTQIVTRDMDRLERLIAQLIADTRREASEGK